MLERWIQEAVGGTNSAASTPRRVAESQPKDAASDRWDSIIQFADDLAEADDDHAIRLLLRFGVYDAMAAAGAVPTTFSTVSEPPADLDRQPPEEVSRVLDAILHQPHTQSMIGESLALLAQRRWQLPHHLLPTILDSHSDGLRAAARPVLGERARWLATLNPRWQWVNETRASNQDDWQQQFDQGGAEQRIEAVLAMREYDLPSALRWTVSMLGREKVDTRVKLIDRLADRVDKPDLVWLEPALAGRSTKVVESAQRAMARIAETDWSKQRVADVREAVQWRDDDRRQLRIRFPAAVPAAKHRGWLKQMAATAPIDLWMETGGTPEQWIAAAGLVRPGIGLIEGWTDVAAMDDVPNRDAKSVSQWRMELLDHWITAIPDGRSAALAAIEKLIPVIGHDQMERVAAKWFAIDPHKTTEVLGLMSWTWTVDLSRVVMVECSRRFKSTDARAISDVLTWLSVAAYRVTPAALKPMLRLIGAMNEVSAESFMRQTETGCAQLRIAAGLRLQLHSVFARNAP
jgi:hypothetical protein